MRAYLPDVSIQITPPVGLYAVGLNVYKPDTVTPRSIALIAEWSKPVVLKLWVAGEILLGRQN